MPRLPNQDPRLAAAALGAELSPGTGRERRRQLRGWLFFLPPPPPFLPPLPPPPFLLGFCPCSSSPWQGRGRAGRSPGLSADSAVRNSKMIWKNLPPTSRNRRQLPLNLPLIPAPPPRFIPESRPPPLRKGLEPQAGLKQSKTGTPPAPTASFRPPDGLAQALGSQVGGSRREEPCLTPFFLLLFF